MGCCGSAEGQAAPLNAGLGDNLALAKPLTLYGDIFDNDTRTILMLLKLANVKVAFTPVSLFHGEHQEEKYLDVNPTGQVPTIVESRYLVMGNTQTFLTYLG